MFRRIKSLFSSVPSSKSTRRRPVSVKRRPSFHPTLEVLEDRLVMSSDPLTVQGNQLIDTTTGQAVVLRGVNLTGLESWYDTSSQNVAQIPQTESVALNDWHANLLRVTIDPDYWYGYGPGQNDGGAGYQQMIANIIKTASDNNAYVMVAVWGTDGPNAQSGKPAEYAMPDEETNNFWHDFATQYGNNPTVMFDPFNEPYNVTAQQWHDGGWIDDAGGYSSPGMEGLYLTIRGTGANNIVAPEGYDYGTNFTDIGPGQTYALTDSNGQPATNVMYQFHLYPDASANSNVTDQVSAIAGQSPIYIGEWGTFSDNVDANDPGLQAIGAGTPDAATWTQNMLKLLDANNYSWTAWNMNVDPGDGSTGGGPFLISDWNNYTPTSYFGQYVHDNLVSHFENQQPPVNPTPTPESATINFTNTGNWSGNNGYTASITVTNTGASDINGWQLEFDLNADTHGEIWNAQIVNQTGNHYVIQGVDGTTIAAGQSITFGFNVYTNNLQIVPANYTLTDLSNNATVSVTVTTTAPPPPAGGQTTPPVQVPGGNGNNTNPGNDNPGNDNPGAAQNPAPPDVPSLLAWFNQLLGDIETVNADGTTITDSLFGFQLVETFDSSGNLVSVTLLGFNLTSWF